MLRDLKNAVKSFLITASGAAILWALVLVYNFHKVYEVFVVHPPQTLVTWTEQKDFQITPGGPQIISQDFLRDNHQYVIEVTSAKEDMLSTSIRVRFQFPYVVEHATIYRSNIASANFELAGSPISLSVVGPARIFGQKRYRNYVLEIPDMPPNGNGMVKIIVLLNSNPKGGMISVGGTSPRKPLPVFPPPEVLGPLCEYIRVTTSVSYGGVSRTFESYSPFQESIDKRVSIGQFGIVPAGLIQTYEP
jgi:hypothetical protein